jgi:Domain of unknown function (DUF4410)
MGRVVVRSLVTLRENHVKTIRLLLLLAAVCGLPACSGNVRHGDDTGSFAYNGQKFSAVKVELTPAAEGKLSDNIKFHAEELQSNVQRRLSTEGLFAEEQPYRIQVVVKDIRVRSTFSAIMWGFMAGDDHIVGDVVILDGDNQPIYQFEVTASYALGGFAGGQDGTRMNWLYERFAELTAQEIRGGTPKQAKS